MPNLYGYDPDEEYTGFGAIPAGAYNAIIVKSEEVKNKSGQGTHLKLEFDILDGPQKGRKVWHRLNLNNPSQVAVRISRSELKTICIACGGVRPTDSVQLHNIPMVIHVDRDGNGFDRIKKFESRGAAPEPETVPPQEQGPGTPPWQK